MFQDCNDDIKLKVMNIIYRNKMKNELYEIKNLMKLNKYIKLN